MMTKGLSKSVYCSAIQCYKILWLDKYKPQEAQELKNDSILDTGIEVGNVAKGLFGEHKNVSYDNTLENMLIETEQLIKDGTSVITEASFSYDNNFCSTDILKNDNGLLDIFEVKSSTEIKDIYIEDLSYQYYILNMLGYKVRSVNIVYLNSEYVRHGNLELDKLFAIENLIDIVISKQSEVELKIESINKYLEQTEEPARDIGLYCSDPYDCKYWQYCTKHLPENNIFDIAGMKRKEKFDLYYKGIFSFNDLRFSNINEKYMEQILFSLDNRTPKIETDKIKQFLDGLYYPLYFLDFETYQQAIPLYDGISPYMQVPFQYSLHYIEQENGELKHTEFLAKSGTDSREELAKRLVNDIPTNACVLAYNMGFEKGVIKNLSENYNHLSESLLKIHNNIQDLMIPFQKRNYYAKEMVGSYSIKKVLPTLFPDDEELNYHNLPLVHNGGEAMNAFADLKNKSEEEVKQIRYGLLEYCKLDTLAMVKIWQKLNEICNQPTNTY